MKNLPDDPFETIQPHEFIKVPHRFNIMLVLYSRGPADFSLLKHGLKMTPGNLDHHLKVLIKEGWVEEKKIFGFRNIKSYSLTDKGRKDFHEYAKILKDLLGEL